MPREGHFHIQRWGGVCGELPLPIFVTKVKMVNVLGILKNEVVFFDTVAIQSSTAEVLTGIGMECNFSTY